MRLRQLKLATVVVPVLFLGAFTWAALFILPDFLQTPAGFGLALTLVTLAVLGFSHAVFGVIERLEGKVREQNRQLSALARIAGASAESSELNKLLAVALDHVLDVMGAEAGAICLLDADGEELVAACHRGFSDELARELQRQKLGDEPVGAKVVRSGQPVIVEDAAAAQDALGGKPAGGIENLLTTSRTGEIYLREGFRASISVPLKAESQVSGVLAVASKQPRRFGAPEVALLTSIGAQLGLAVRNALLFAKSRQRNQELAALLAVGRAATSSLDLTALLDEALEALIEVTSAEAAEVWLVTPDGDVELARQHGLPPALALERTRFGRGEGLPGRVVETGMPVIIHDLPSQPGLKRESFREAGFQTYCLFPLQQRGETLGVLTVAAHDKEALSSVREQRLLEGIGEQVAIATENARLHGRVLDVAVLEERERIARELHDGLAQVLGYINTQTLAIRKLLASGRAKEAEAQLQVMEEAARQVYADVREAILGLSTSLDDPGGLIPSLRKYLARYSEMANLAVELDASPEAQALRLPAMAEIQLMRIVQEALSNCRKHAGATAVRVAFLAEGGALLAEIADDGQGFDAERPGRPGWPRFGLQTMHERAQAIEGTFEVVSRPGRGTTVRVRVPVKSAVSEVAHARAARR